MTLAGPSLETLSIVSQSYEARDKTARMFQFMARLVLGLTQDQNNATTAGLHAAARRFMVSISGSRRTFRWGRELQVLRALVEASKASNLAERLTGVLRHANALMFFSLDHVGWFGQVLGGMKRGQRMIRLGLKFLTMSCLIAVAQSTIKLRNLNARVKNDPEQWHRADGERQIEKISIVRNGLMAIQVAHLSRLWETHDVFVGSLGIVTSIIDIMSVWPRRKHAD